MLRQKHTNVQQFKLLLEFLEKYPHLATASPLSVEGRVTANNLWENQVDVLNAVGPPVNTVDKWKKVWKDWKYKIRSKITGNKLVRTGTGGGPSNEYYFTDLEERVIDLINVRETIDGVGRRFGAPVSSVTQPNETEDTPNETGTSTDTHLPAEANPSENLTHAVSPAREASNSRPQPTSVNRKRALNKKSLLQKQINIQDTAMKNINLKLTKICKQNEERNNILRKMYNLKFLKFKYQKERDARNSNQHIT